MRTLSLFGTLFTFLLLSGCGNKMYPVRGQVVFEDGTPANELAGYAIMFQSQEHKTSAAGTIQPDGTFSVGTHTDTDGAMLGKQRVAITPPIPLTHVRRAPSKIHERYGGFDTSQLEIDIKPETNQPTITVERAKK